MSQPPVSGSGLGEEPGPDPRLSTGSPALDEAGSHGPGLDEAGSLRLADFAEGGPGDACLPGPGLAAALDTLCGPDQRCPGADDDQLIGLLGRWQALEAWAAAGKLGVVRELVRRRADHRCRHPAPGELPHHWDRGTGHEVSEALTLSLPAADRLSELAWALRARLPGIAAALAAGSIDYVKAAIIVKELAVLDDEHAALAEALILGELAGKTAGMIARLAADAAATVDPEGTRKRREQAERDEARVRLWRENSGACTLAGYGLPTDAALAAHAAISQRAKEYKKAKVSPGATMDQLRVIAYCDILNGITADARIAQARAAQAQAEAEAGAGAEAEAGAGAEAGPDDSAGPDGAPDDDGRPSGTGPADDGPDPADDRTGPADTDPADDRTGPAGTDPASDPGDPGDGPPEPGGTGPGDGPGGTGHASGTGPADDDSDPADDRTGPAGTCPRGSEPHGAESGSGKPGAGDAGGAGGDAGPALPTLANLTFPLATLQKLADRPGQAHGYGPLDPALTRDLAAAAARSPHSKFCITITDSNGYAIAHGCARPARKKQATPPSSRGRDSPWTLSPRDGPGPKDGYGSWTLTLPGGRELIVDLVPVPVTSCDHRYESHSYQPSDTLRHLVQIRDGTCTFPSCSRHARHCDFEHTTPYDQGGRTCACNASARSRRCHRVKQSKLWSVSQPLPGWSQWTTPSGRTYTQGPMRYPA